MTPHPLPRDCGRRLLPALVDELAAIEPRRVFLSYPTGPRPRDGYRDITFKVFATAVNRCSWWLKENLGHSNDFRTLRYFGPPDLRSTVLLYAAVKTGHKLFLSSISFDGVDVDVKLLEDLDCTIMLLTAESPPYMVKSILSRRSMQTLVLPSLEELLMPGEVPIYAYNKSYSEAQNEPFVVLHTSGSTGPPKPVSLNHGTLAHHDLFLHAPSFGGRSLNMARFSGKRVLLNLPQFHSAAVCFLAFSVYSMTIPVLCALPVSAEIVNEAHLYAGVEASFLVPNILTDIARNQDYCNNLGNLQYITFGGSPLPQDIGDKVKDFSHLFVSFGTTECGFYPLEETEREDWQYYRFSPLMGHELRPSADDLYELFFVRDTSSLRSQGAFATFPLLSEYSTKDIYSKHPSKDGLWSHEGRTDDIISLSHSLKHYPLGMERSLETQAMIRSALVCGQGRERIAVLIEAKSATDSEEERSAAKESVWPSIELLNQDVPDEHEYARIKKNLVLFTFSARPMVRAGKGSVLRRKTVELYKSDLDHLYMAYSDERYDLVD